MDLNKALKVFGLEHLEDSSIDDIKLKYRSLAKLAHPDGGGESSDFIQLQEAYNLILQKYDTDKDPNRKELKILSKEEILDKYYRDKKHFEIEIQELELKIQTKNRIVNQTFYKAQDLTEKYNSKNSKVQQEFEKKINALHSDYFPSMWKKLIFFWNLKKKSDFENQLNTVIDHYQGILNQQYQEYLTNLNHLYTKGLDDLNIKYLDPEEVINSDSKEIN